MPALRSRWLRIWIARHFVLGIVAIATHTSRRVLLDRGFILGAEALGLGATGIGAFFDDDVHRYLELTSGQVVYHFAIGYPVFDPRVEA